MDIEAVLFILYIVSVFIGLVLMGIFVPDGYDDADKIFGMVLLWPVILSFAAVAIFFLPFAGFLYLPYWIGKRIKIYIKGREKCSY